MGLVPQHREIVPGYGKMSMIHEEDHSVELPNIPNLPRSSTENKHKTTFDNIKEYHSNMARLRESGYTRNSSEANTFGASNLTPQQLNRFNNPRPLNNNDDYDQDNISLQSDYDDSVSKRKGRFEVRKILEERLNNELRSEPYRNDPQSDIAPDYYSNLSLDKRNSSEAYMNYGVGTLQPRKSFTEYSLKDRFEAGASKNYPFVQGLGNNIGKTDSNFSYQNRGDPQRTPMFTMSNAPNMFMKGNIPPLSFEQIDENHTYENFDEEKNNKAIYETFR